MKAEVSISGSGQGGLDSGPGGAKECAEGDDYQEGGRGEQRGTAEITLEDGRFFMSGGVGPILTLDDDMIIIVSVPFAGEKIIRDMRQTILHTRALYTKPQGKTGQSEGWLADKNFRKLPVEEDIFAAEVAYFGPLKKALAAINDWIEAKKDSAKE